MPQPSGAPVSFSPDEVRRRRAPKRGVGGDDGDQAHKSWRVDAVDDQEGPMTYQELCQCIREEFPDLADEWSGEFPELATSAQLREGDGRDDTRLETGRPPLPSPGCSTATTRSRLEWCVLRAMH